jgi:hypothetical protein
MCYTDVLFIKFRALFIRQSTKISFHNPYQVVVVSCHCATLFPCRFSRSSELTQEHLNCINFITSMWWLLVHCEQLSFTMIAREICRSFPIILVVSENARIRIPWKANNRAAWNCYLSISLLLVVLLLFVSIM